MRWRHLFFGLFLAASPALADTTPSAHLYDELIARAESGDTAIDYTALRISYTMTDHYQPYPGEARKIVNEAFQALQNKDCATATEKSKAVLKINYADILAHTMLSDCYEQAGDAAAATREHAIGKGLLDLLFASGDGKTIATAFVVISLDEEKLLMDWDGAQEEQQSLISDHGHKYDMLSGKTKAGDAVSLYFNVDYLFGHLDKVFRDKS